METERIDNLLRMPRVSRVEYCLQAMSSTLDVLPRACSEPQVKTKVFLVNTSQCVPCF